MFIPIAFAMVCALVALLCSYVHKTCIISMKVNICAIFLFKYANTRRSKLRSLLYTETIRTRSFEVSEDDAIPINDGAC